MREGEDLRGDSGDCGFLPTVAASKQHRLVADPTIGVSDVMDALKRFLENADEKKMNLYSFGVSWKSSACASWLTTMGPPLTEFLAIAKNGVLPGKRAG